MPGLGQTRLALLRWALACLLAPCLSACGATLSRIPVDGAVHGQPLQSTVDSPFARYYLEEYLAGQGNRPDWDENLTRLQAQSNDIFRDPAQMRELSREYSVDTLALLFAHHVLGQPGNQQIQAEFVRQLAALNAMSGIEGTSTRTNVEGYRLVFVPGWLYQSKPWTGADFAGPRAILDQFGADHHLIEVLDNGPIELNARLVALDLLPLLEDNKPTIIISGSKGGPEVAMALGQLLTPEQTRPIRAWINICGALNGSPLANIWTTWPSSWLSNTLFQLRGWGGLNGLRSMRTERSLMRNQGLRIPDDILVVNYVGVPVSGTIIEKEFEKRFTYSQLRDYGPNDGLVLVPDEVADNSITVIELGRGHFLSEPDFDVRTTALLNTVIQRLKAQETVALPVSVDAPDS